MYKKQNANIIYIYILYLIKTNFFARNFLSNKFYYLKKIVSFFFSYFGIFLSLHK
jgi:hypothetical protein